VAVVLTPFGWEGANKAEKAAQGLDNLRNTADTVIVVSNEKLLTLCEKGVKVKEAYRVADGVLIQGVRGITDLILRPGTLNGDFADVEAVLRNGREALIGTGVGRGEEALLDALQRALDCPLLERDARGSATQVIVSVMADWDQVELSAVETAMRFLSRHYNGQADIKLCQVEAPELEDRALVTVLASGFTDPDQDDFPVREREPEPVLAVPEPRSQNVDTGRVYGEIPAEGPMMTPTRLLPQAPTPSGEMVALTEDLHVPAIIRMNMTQGRLPIE
jgi:cell division protein FtsZ